MHRPIPTPAGRPARDPRPWFLAWLWALAALLATLALPARAADYTDGVAVSGSTATIWFKSNVATTWVDVHYAVNGGGQLNVRMTYSSANARYEQPVTGVANGTVLTYNFTYNNGTPAYDTPTESYTVGGTTQSGIACFYADVNYAGDSFCASADSSYVGATWNDRISSVKVAAGNKVVLYADANYAGAALTLTADTASLVGLSFNDVASSFRINPSTIPTSDNPDFGPNVKVFDTSTPTSTIQSALDSAFNSQLLSPTAQFGSQRYAFLFKPGSYAVNANLGFYTSIAGLGQNPDNVTINGSVNVDSGWNYGDQGNATQNFWRSAENLAVVPTGGTDRWAVSQAAPMRRIHVVGNLVLGPSNQGNGQGYASGGYIADSKVDGLIASGSQQQWYTRDSNIGNWYDGVWNMVFSGVVGAPAQTFPAPPYTVLATTPVSREKPYLYVDASGKYRVFVPALRTNASGATWAAGATPGTSIPMSQFYVAKAGDTAATFNAALAQGLNLFFTPGTWHLNDTIRITRANTVVLGIGFPTLQPDNGVDAMSVADVDGVKIAGLLFDAGTTNSTNLLLVGPAGASASHASNPISVQDTYFRIGGAVAGKATNSLVVNGANVLATGLFVEHYQKFNVVWNGQGGKTIFFQNELPYDPPSQTAWRPDATGYAAYKVGAGVTTHEGWGLGSYCYFNVNPAIHEAHSFEVPAVAGVKFHSLLTVSLGGVGVIDHVINNTGAAAQGAATVPVNVVSFP